MQRSKSWDMIFKMSFSSNYFQYLKKKYPLLEQNNPQQLESNLGENLITPLVTQIPHKAMNWAQDLVQLLFKIRNSSIYQELFHGEMEKHGICDPENHSILMSYDFHYHNDQLKLIEVNTNASFLALGYELYEFTKTPRTPAKFQMEDWIANIKNELALQKKAISHPRVGILDNDPENQKLYLEFLIYKNILDNQGMPTEIMDVKSYTKDIPLDFIYNRSTDFYLESPGSQYLKTQFLNKSICLSPNPFEYLLLADKARLKDWSNPDFFEKLEFTDSERALLQSSIPKTLLLNPHSQEWLWEHRKNFFFKPVNSYGSKSAYSGRGISRIKFNELLSQNTLAQEFIPAGIQIFGDQEFKYDLRFYVYEDQIQMVLARLYQGQLTNFKPPLGGWSCVQVTEFESTKS